MSWMLIVAACIAGWVIPEIMIAGRARIPLGINVLSMVSCGLFAAYFVR